MGTTTNFLDRVQEDISDGTLPEAPQDNLGAYTLRAGDTLEHIALQIYGDSSLWYLLADANGISDKHATVGNSGQLHIGQRLNIPPVATGQHQTHGTHKVLNANQMIGNTSATTKAPMPAAPPPLPKRHNGLFAKIVVGIIAVVATVMTAGILGALAGATLGSGAGGLFALGTAVLGGTATAATGVSLAASFAAGFVGSIASQGAAKALGMQEEVSFKGALISGLATAATAGLIRGVNNNTIYQKLVNSVDKLSLSQTFSIASAAQLMEQNAVSQGINLTLQKHQHFDWEQLATAGITAGLMGGTVGKALDKTLRTVDHNTGILTTEFRAITSAGANSVVTGSHFGATQVLTDNLGSAVASGLVDLASEKDLARLKLKEIEEELNDYCPIPSEDGAFSRIPEGTYERFHEEVDDAASRNYLAQKLSGSERYQSSSEHLSNKQSQSLGNYQSLSFDSDLSNSGVNNLDFESKVYWNSKEHGVKQFIEDSSANLDRIGISFNLNKVNQSVENNFNITDAKNGLKKVYEQYGADITKTVEKMYRFETRHFTSAQYRLTGTPGMEAPKGAKAPYYGWSSDFFKANPAYAPIGTTGLHDGKGMPGGNKQKIGVVQYIKFSSVEAGMLHLAHKIKNVYHGDYAKWHSVSNLAIKQKYREGLKYVKWDITKQLMKELDL